MRRPLALLVALLLLWPGAVSLAEENPADGDVMPAVRYVGVAQQSVSIRTEPSTDAEALPGFSLGATVYILAYEPAWLTVCRELNGKWITGYVPRHTVSEVRDYGTQPLPYGTTPSSYVANVSKSSMLRAAPSITADPLFQVPEGAKIAILSIENGWAKVIYWRQYGYLYLDAVANLTPVYPTQDAQPGDVIAAFISFYDTNTKEINQNRIHNIKQACEYISITLKTGARFQFNTVAGPYTSTRGFLLGPSFVDGADALSGGGGVCQVSSTMYNVLLALPDGIKVEYRRAHGPSGAVYLPHGVDAAVGSDTLDLLFVNKFNFPVRIEACAIDGVLYIALHRGEGGS